MQSNNNRYTYLSVLFSVLTYVLVITLLAFNSIKAPMPEEEEGILFEFEELPQIEEESPLLEKDIEDMNSEERRNFAVNKALTERDQTDPYDYSDVEEADENYKESLIKKAISESEYQKIFEREDLDIEDAYNDSEEKKEDKIEEQTTPSNFQGATYISYFLKNRHKLKIPVPTYKCESSGTVVVNIEVNRKGKVSSFKIDNQSTSNTCLRDAAIASVKKARFNQNYDAPLKQQGTITYVFEAQ